MQMSTRCQRIVNKHDAGTGKEKLGAWRWKNSTVQDPFENSDNLNYGDKFSKDGCSLGTIWLCNWPSPFHGAKACDVFPVKKCNFRWKSLYFSRSRSFSHLGQTNANPKCVATHPILSFSNAIMSQNSLYMLCGFFLFFIFISATVDDVRC